MIHTKAPKSTMMISNTITSESVKIPNDLESYYIAPNRCSASPLSKSRFSEMTRTQFLMKATYLQVAKGNDKAFTLIELLVVISIIAILAGLLLPSLSRAKSATQRTHCLSQMKQLAMGVMMYADDHRDELPRSQHSAFAFRQSPWAISILPYLGQSNSDNHADNKRNIRRGVFRCSKVKDPEKSSYGQNVYFELGADDDYLGRPTSWRKLTSIPRRSATILQGEVTGRIDHIMAHFWREGAEPEVATDRHGAEGKSNYSFADGHAESRQFLLTYDEKAQRDLWNPLTSK